MPICWKWQMIQSVCTNKPVLQYQYANRVHSGNEDEASGISKHRNDRSQTARANKREPIHQRMVLWEELAIC
jgi:hypothetical protein